MMTETVPDNEKVKSCKLSSCGQFLLYGCFDGSVKMFEIKSKSTSVIVKLSGVVHYLQVFGSSSSSLTVIAAGEDNSLKVFIFLQLLIILSSVQQDFNNNVKK
jgi:WD40 repeat protein